MSGATTDADDALIDEETLMQIMNHLDIDGDGDVSKEEYMVPWMKLFPKLTRADYDKVWKEIDKDESGTLSLPELASYYGEGRRVNLVGRSVDPPLTDPPLANVPPRCRVQHVPISPAQGRPDGEHVRRADHGGPAALCHSG